MALQRRIADLENAVELLTEILGEQLPDEPRLAEVVAMLSDDDHGLPPQSPPVPPGDGPNRAPRCSTSLCCP